MIALIVWFTVEAFHQQPPPPVATTEVNRSVHGFHALRFQPGPALIKQFKSSLPVVDAFEKTHSASSLIVALLDSLLVYECRNAPYRYPFVIDQDPSNTLAVPECFVFIRIKNLLNIFIKGPYPILIMLIQYDGEHKKFSGIKTCPDFANYHGYPTSAVDVVFAITLLMRLGSRIVKRVPCPTRLATVICPPSFSTAFLTMYRPIPEPSDCSVAL
jgi:hypothetical protein